jgi:hypothetical protein
MTEGEVGFHITLTPKQKAKMAELPYGYQKKSTQILLDQLLSLMETNPQGEVLNGLEKGEIGIGFSYQWSKVIEALCDELRYHLDQDGQAHYTSEALTQGMMLVNWMKGYMIDAPTHDKEIADGDDEGGTDATHPNGSVEATEG